MDPIIIHSAEPGYWYAVFYAAAFLVGFLLLVWEGWRNRLPMLPWCLVIATAFLLFIIGTQVVKWRYTEWQHVIQFERLSVWPGRSVLGGILFFIPGLLLAKYLLRFRHHVVDSFAVVFPLGMAIQRAGCFMAGCCFGKPTGLPWGVRYADHTDVFYHQVNAGLISETSLHTLSVHPVQLYDLISCLLIVLILHRSRPRIMAPGNFLFASVFLYGCFRFFLEFIRTHTHPWEFFLTPVQIALLVLMPPIAIWMYRRERCASTRTESIEYLPTPFRNSIYFTGLMTLFLLTANWLSVLEILCFTLVLIPLLAMIVWQAFRRVTIPSLRWATLSLIASSAFTMSQTYPEYSRNKDAKLSYWTAGFGIMGGSNSQEFNPSQSSCGTQYATYFRSDFSVRALHVGYVKQLGDERSLAIGASGVWGNLNESRSKNWVPSGMSAPIGAFSPFVQWNEKIIGLGVGFHAGNTPQLSKAHSSDNSSVNSLTFLPSFNFRFGSLRTAFFEYRYNNQFPSPYPTLMHQVALGIGTGKRGGALRIGSASHISLFAEQTLTLGDNVSLVPYIGFGGGLFNSGSASDGGQASLSLHVKFSRKEK